MISLLPMAGRGSRFVKENYSLPKPFIPVMGYPMFVAAIKSFPSADKHVFICQSQFLEKYPFEDEVRKYYSNFTVVSLDEITEGQACTCLLAEKHMNMNEELLISSIDYQFVYDKEAFEKIRKDQSIDVIIFTLQIKYLPMQSPNAFAYCRVENEHVVEVVEKRTISDNPKLDPAVVGTFYYRCAKDFVRGARSMIAKNIRINGEFYVGTSINQLIEEGLRVKIFPVNKFISFGNPFELQLYQSWEDYFYMEENHPYKGWNS